MLLNSVWIGYLPPPTPLVTLLFPFQRPTIASLFFVFCPPSSPLAKRTDEACPSTSFPRRELGQVRPRSPFANVSAVGPVSRVNIWTHSTKWSPGGEANARSIAVGFALKQTNPRCMKRAVTRAECWCKVGHLFLHALM